MCMCKYNVMVIRTGPKTHTHTHANINVIKNVHLLNVYI